METEHQEAAKTKFPVQVATTSASKKELSANTQKSGSKNALLPAWKWWQSLGSPRFILSPMVGQSELAYRMLCRKHGVQLCYTPMFIAESFVHDAAYRKRIWSTCKEDRPLFVQFCGNKPEMILEAAKLVEGQCDGIDINFGCPQKVAERGNYGAFLMDDWEKLVSIVWTLSHGGLSVPVTVKMRVYESVHETVAVCQMLVQAGASLICLHPRQRHQREEVLADWNQIKKVKAAVGSVPIIANGDCWHAEDVWLCMRQTCADGFMSAQGLLHNPAMFVPLMGMHPTRQQIAEAPSLADELPHYMRRRRKVSAYMTLKLSFSFQTLQKKLKGHKSAVPPALLTLPESPNGTQCTSSFFSSVDDVKRQFKLASQYLYMCDRWPVPHPSIMRRHVFFLLFDALQANVDLYDQLYEGSDTTMATTAELRTLVAHLLSRAEAVGPPQNRSIEAKKRPTRRDGSLAPPPWPVGGGGLHVRKKRPPKSHSARAHASATTKLGKDQATPRAALVQGIKASDAQRLMTKRRMMPGPQPARASPRGQVKKGGAPANKKKRMSKAERKRLKKKTKTK